MAKHLLVWIIFSFIALTIDGVLSMTILTVVYIVAYFVVDSIRQNKDS